MQYSNRRTGQSREEVIDSGDICRNANMREACNVDVDPLNDMKEDKTTHLTHHEKEAMPALTQKQLGKS